MNHKIDWTWKLVSLDQWTINGSKDRLQKNKKFDFKYNLNNLTIDCLKNEIKIKRKKQND